MESFKYFNLFSDFMKAKTLGALALTLSLGLGCAGTSLKGETNLKETIQKRIESSYFLLKSPKYSEENWNTLNNKLLDCERTYIERFPVKLTKYEYGEGRQILLHLENFKTGETISVFSLLDEENYSSCTHKNLMKGDDKGKVVGPILRIDDISEDLFRRFAYVILEDEQLESESSSKAKNKYELLAFKISDFGSFAASEGNVWGSYNGDGVDIKICFPNNNGGIEYKSNNVDGILNEVYTYTHTFTPKYKEERIQIKDKLELRKAQEEYSRYTDLLLQECNRIK